MIGFFQIIPYPFPRYRVSFTILFVIYTCTHQCFASSKHHYPDAIYVIGMKQCTQRWEQVNKWASAKNLSLTLIYGYTYSDIRLQQPPIPITGIRKGEVIMAGQVGCTMSHIKAWRDAFKKRYSAVIILEDDVHMSDSLLKAIPSILKNATEGSKRRHQLPWHYIYLRMQPTEFLESRQIWYGDLRIANPGWGTASYVASAAGIQYLLTRVTSYSNPLDVQIERFQRGKDTQGAEFIALDACGLNSAGKFPVGCPENINELTIAERGNCFFSASNVGEELQAEQFPGVIR